LSGARKVDPATRQALQEALADIQAALAAAETAPEEEQPSAPEGLAERLRGTAAKFEATHPTLAGTIERLIDLLGAAGI
jgi:ABC-type transporter Mla subunit MlaD